MTLLLAGSAAPSGGASSSVLFGSLAVINVVFVGLFFLVRWMLNAFRPRVPAAFPTTISRLPRESADGTPAARDSRAAISGAATSGAATSGAATSGAAASGAAASGAAISGVVAAGPDGPFTSPLSRETCAWYRLQSFRARQGIDDVRWEKVSELDSKGDVLITDGTGTVRLSMSDVEHFGGWFVRSTTEPRRPGTGTAARVGTALLGRTLRQEEYVMPVGARVTVLGDLVAVDGQVRPAAGAEKLVATPLSVEAWHADQAALRVKVRRTRVFTYVTCAVMVALVNAVILWAALTTTR